MTFTPCANRPRMRFLLITLIFPIIGLTTGCRNSTNSEGNPTQSNERKARIELASFIPASVTVLGEQIVHIADQLDRVSGGSISMKIYDPGALVGALEILDAVSDGKVDAGYGASGFWAGKIPAAPLFSAIPFGPDSAEFMAWLYHGNGLELYQEMYDQQLAVSLSREGGGIGLADYGRYHSVMKLYIN